jgi:hypothetical protein
MIFMKKIFILLFAVLSLGGCAVGSVKEPSFTVVEKQGDIEIRRYDPMIVAEVTMTGDRKTAINNGFRVLADYIFGNNTAAKDIAMTAPVTQQKAEKIAMTAPVTQQSAGADTWRVHFVMPADYTMDTLPKPKDDQVKIISVPSYDAAVIRFSGLAGDSVLRDREQQLADFVASSGRAALSIPTYAFYNPPWTLPFLRRNEVMVTLAPQK